MKFPFEIISTSENDTRNIAEEFAKELKNGDLVLFRGNLGSGKTFFVQAVCASFKIDSVTSPTFSLVNEYQGNKKILHIDLYRIEDEREFKNIGLDEYLSDDEAIKFIEWAELFEEHLREYDFLITMEFIDDFKRKIKIEKR